MLNACPSAIVGRSILVVDDIELTRILTVATLAHAGYDVDCAADGATALEAIARKVYDLVLVDLNMPDLAGHAIAAAMRRQGSASPIKLVALSSKRCADDRDLSADFGMDGHIARPISPPDLLRAVEALLRAPYASAKGGATPEIWNRAPYRELSDLLGPAKLEVILVRLLAQCEADLHALADRTVADETVRHQAHDLSSIAGMLGFEALSRRCLDLLALPTETSRRAATPLLVMTLTRTIAVLGRHVASIQTAAAA